MDGPAAFAHMINCGFDVMAATLDPATSAVMLQVGDSTNEVVDHDQCELWQPNGFASMPAAPTQGAASCQGIAIKHSDRDMCFALRDLRAASIYGNLKPGDTACYETGSVTAISLWKAADKSVNHMTADANGNSIFRRLSPTEDRFWAPWGSQWHDATGWHLRDRSGVKVDAMALGFSGPLAPLASAGLSSTFAVSADIVHLNGALVTIGRGGTAGSVVQAVPLQAVMTSLATSLGLVALGLTDIATQLASLGKPATQVAASVTALAVTITALATITTPAPAGCATKSTVA